MELMVPGQELKKIRLEAAKLMKKTTPPPVREVSCLLGKLNSVSQAIPSGPLFCRMLQRDVSTALETSNQSYEVPCPLSGAAIEELTWWQEQLSRWNGKSLALRNLDLQIESDASLTGWGASCKGVTTSTAWS